LRVDAWEGRNPIRWAIPRTGQEWRDQFKEGIDKSVEKVKISSQKYNRIVPAIEKKVKHYLPA